MSVEQMEEDRLLASSPDDFSMDEQFLLQSSDEELDEYIENAGCMNRCLHALMSVRQEMMQKGTVAKNYDHFLFHPLKDYYGPVRKRGKVKSPKIIFNSKALTTAARQRCKTIR